MGNRGSNGVYVSIDGPGMMFADHLDARRDLCNHSPDGFEFGYGGSGPLQLGLAILADVTRDDAVARQFYISFVTEIVSQWKDNTFSITAGEVRAWLAKHA